MPGVPAWYLRLLSALPQLMPWRLAGTRASAVPILTSMEYVDYKRNNDATFGFKTAKLQMAAI